MAYVAPEVRSLEMGIQPYGAPRSNAEDLAQRVKLASGLGLQPAQALALAQANPNYSDLMDKVEATNGFVASVQEANLLASRSDQDQRRIWDRMTKAQKRALLSQGYKAPPPEPGFWENFSEEIKLTNIPRNIGEGVMGTFEALGAPLRLAQHLYRTSQEYETEGRGTESGHIDPIKRFKFGLASVLPFTAPILVADSDFREAWTRTSDGERYFRPEALRAAERVAGEDTEVFRYAVALASADDEYEAIKALSGAEIGDPAYSQEFRKFIEVSQDPRFESATSKLMMGKVSPGRDLARGLGLPESSNFNSSYNRVSAAGDFLYTMFADPLLALGKVNKAHRAAKWGIDMGQSRSVINGRIMSFVGENLDGRAAFNRSERLAALAADDTKGYYDLLRQVDLNPAERYATAVTDHFTTDKFFRLSQLDPNIQTVLKDLQEFKRLQGFERVAQFGQGARGLDRPSDFFTWMTSDAGVVDLAKGRFGSYLRHGEEIPHLSKVGTKRISTKISMRNTIDFLANDTKAVFTLGADDLLAGGRFLGDPAAMSALERGQQLAFDLMRPFAQFTDTLLKHLPREQGLKFNDPRFAEELKRVLSMGFGQHDRMYWYDALLSDKSEGAQRLLLRNAFNVMFDTLGIRNTPDGRKWADEWVELHHQRYSTGGRDLMEDGAHSALLPWQDLAHEVAIPGFADVRRMMGQSKRLSLNYMLFGSTPAGMADAFMNVWKPSVVLRLGFIPRAGGEEALAFVARVGAATLGQHWGPLALAKRPDEEGLVFFRANARFLNWMNDLEMVRNDPTSIVSAHIGNLIHKNAEVSGLITPRVRQLARLPYEKGLLSPDRLAAAQEVYKNRRMFQLASMERAVANAEEYLEVATVDLPNMGMVRIDQEAQARLVRGRRRHVQRISYARQVWGEPVLQRAFADQWGKISSVEGANVLGATPDSLRDATVMARGTGITGRPKTVKMVLRPRGSDFVESNLAETGNLKDFTNWMLRWQRDPVGKVASEITSLYMDDATGEIANFRRAYNALDDNNPIRFVIRDYLRTQDPADYKRLQELTGRGSKVIQNLDAVDAAWLKKYVEDLPLMDRGVAAQAIANSRAGGLRYLDPDMRAAIESGDLDALDSAGREALRRFLSSPTAQKQLERMDRFYRMPKGDGRIVEHPPQPGFVRSYVPLLTPRDRALVRGGDYSDLPPRVQNAIRAILDSYDEKATNIVYRVRSRQAKGSLSPLMRGQLDPGTGRTVPTDAWSTTDAGLADEVASAFSRYAKRVGVGRYDVPMDYVGQKRFGQPRGSFFMEEPYVHKLHTDAEVASVDEAIRSHANLLWDEFKEHAFSGRTGKPLSPVTRAVADGELDLEHVRSVAEDLPRKALVPLKVPERQGLLAQMVTKGMNEVIGPAIDAMVREPMFIEAAMKGMRASRWVRPYMIDNRLLERMDSVAAEVTGINLADDLIDKIRQADEVIEYRPIPDPDSVAYASGGRIIVDRQKLMENYASGLERGSRIMADGRSVADALDVDLQALYRWFEQHGGYEAYERFVVNHEKAHVVLGHTHREAPLPAEYPLRIHGGFNPVVKDEQGVIIASRGSKVGDGKDLAMRESADRAIVELTGPAVRGKKVKPTDVLPGEPFAAGKHTELVTSTLVTNTRLIKGVPPGSLESSSFTSVQRLGAYNGEPNVRVMLSRNYELQGKPLHEDTIKSMYVAHKRGATFLVGDSEVDEPFIRVLEKWGAKWELYHTGDTPRIKLGGPGAVGGRGRSMTLAMNFSWGKFAREGITTPNTFEAIFAGERTATTRWGAEAAKIRKLKVGDEITVVGPGGRRRKVRVTKEAYPVGPKVEGFDMAEWSRLEGWSETKGEDFFKRGEGWQVQFEPVSAEVGVTYTTTTGQRGTLAGHQAFNLPETAPEIQRVKAREALLKQMRVKAERTGYSGPIDDTMTNDDLFSIAKALDERVPADERVYRRSTAAQTNEPTTDFETWRKEQEGRLLNQPLGKFPFFSDPSDENLRELMRTIGVRSKNLGMEPEEVLAAGSGSNPQAIKEFMEWLRGDKDNYWARYHLDAALVNDYTFAEIGKRSQEIKAYLDSEIPRVQQMADSYWRSPDELTPDALAQAQDLQDQINHMQELQGFIDGVVIPARSPQGMAKIAKAIDQRMVDVKLKMQADEFPLRGEGLTYDESTARIRLDHEKEANDMAFALMNMPFGDYVSKADEARETLRAAWISVPEHLKGKDVPPARLANSPEVPDIIKKMSPRQLAVLRATDGMLGKIEHLERSITWERAMNDVIPYIDSSNIRGQMQSYIRHLAPFYFAEEQFLKRWARTMVHSPEAIRKGQLLWNGLQNVGLVEENDFGEPVFVYPGTGAMKQGFAKVASLVTGKDIMIPEASNFTGQVRYALPGMDNAGLPASGPLVALSMKALSGRFPELRAPLEEFQRLTGGERSVGRGVADLIIPTALMRFYYTLRSDPDSDRRYMKAQADVMRWMAANDLDPGENATTAELEAYQERVKNWTRTTFMLQAVLGFATPTTPTLDVPSLNPEFRKLLAATDDYEVAIAEFLRRHPDALAETMFATKSKSGYSFPTTKSTAPFIFKNRELLDHYEYAGAYLIPDAPPGEDFDRQAYSEAVAYEMRMFKSPEQVLRELYYRQGAKTYYDSMDNYEQAYNAVTDPNARRAMRMSIAQWKQEFFATHPVFHEELMTGEAKARRLRIMNEMKQLLAREDVQETPNAAALQTLVGSYDNFLAAMQSLSVDVAGRSERASLVRDAVRTQFDNWARGYVSENQAVEHFYLRVIRPEIRGLPGLEEAEAA